MYASYMSTYSTTYPPSRAPLHRSSNPSTHPIYPAHKAGRPRSLRSSVCPSVRLSVCLSVCERDGWMDGRRTGTGIGIGIVCTCVHGRQGKARRCGARQDGYPSLHTDRHRVPKYRDTMEERPARPSLLHCCCCSYICMYACMYVCLYWTGLIRVLSTRQRDGLTGPGGERTQRKRRKRWKRCARAGAGWDCGYTAGGRQQARARYT
ncbi:hypothetical protein BKA81DRAFT_149769 [Phyllosticta paracitricarpa]|uniref:Uncharacterized protein n=1 Tax=Phyllosticta paracitricarpa TaxID=2016321 RepID=A0ABR1NJR3_9PEZI